MVIVVFFLDLKLMVLKFQVGRLRLLHQDFIVVEFMNPMVEDGLLNLTNIMMTL